MSRVRIAFQRLLNDQRQAVETFAHVGMAGRQPNSRSARQQRHRRDKALTTRASAAASTSAPTRIRSPPASTISMRPAVGDGADEIDTGTSCAASTLAAASVGRDCLRHVKSILALRPYRCATCATDAPGAKLSAMIFRFSSAGQDRRRGLEASEPSPGPRSLIDSVHDP